ncbi:MAG TPA: SpoIIE family protein phosphatase [Mycobacterium sp.]|uniref:SpoIIE family protein phosphatase n=1 Tax=Mycolicibacterium sp. TaxID=2320850 RepID=UPI0025D9E73F|nr:SpoIIE family protein phosphatase [Mycolicibacterium sp.]HPX38377.1 SpoIIE family protein phosphatase [Mycobacterium sp.]HQC78351.1 SpoIIE family protein phosphatase [Mycobacterium sp.]
MVDDFGRDEIARFGGLLDSLDLGLVSMDPGHDFAHVNQAAAALLGFPAGVTTTSAVTTHMMELARRSLNPVEITAMVSDLRHDPLTEVRSTWLFPESPTHLGVVSKPAPYPGFEGRIWAFYDNSFLAQASALAQANFDALMDPQVLVQGIRSGSGPIVDLVYREVNRSTCEYLGLTRDDLLGHSLMETLPNLVGSGLFEYYSNCADTGAPVVLNDFPYRNELLHDLRYYDIRAAQAGQDFISLTWRDVTERTELAQRISASEERFRMLAENVADVVVRLHDGKVSWISNSVADALGAPAEDWIGKRVIDFVVPEERAAYRQRVLEAEGGKTFIGRVRLLDANGARHWVHFSSKPYYEADGTPNGGVASFRVIDDEVDAEETARRQIEQRDRQNRSLTRRLQDQTDRLMSELGSAARYVASILPGDLDDGPVRISSRYVSSRELGGDSYDYRWIDEDHLIAYLVDVSGHGVESAMVSMSVHNLLRSGTVPREMLLEPEAMLTELNRLFPMESQGGNYFTAWYGVYQPSTRTLRYASAGHPPALALIGGPNGVEHTELATAAIPVGVMADAAFTSGTYVVPAGTDVLLYSDGAYELSLTDGTWMSLAKFVDLCARIAATDDWTLDTLVVDLLEVSALGLFEDDCTLVRLTID